MEKKKITVFVAGQKLTLITTESEKYVTDIAQKVDTAINSLFSSSNMSREKCAVMAALDFCDDEAKSRIAINEIKEQIKDYIEDSAKLRKENAELLEKIEKLESERLELLSAKKRMIATSVEIKEEKPQPVETEKVPQISAEDDLFFDDEELTAQVSKTVGKVQKSEKKRHNHEHINPYREQFMQKKAENKGYTPTRQYNLFDESKDM